jgi:hypothetical protein
MLEQGEPLHVIYFCSQVSTKVPMSEEGKHMAFCLLLRFEAHLVCADGLRNASTRLAEQG